METTILKEWMIEIPESTQLDEPNESSECDFNGAELAESQAPNMGSLSINLAA